MTHMGKAVDDVRKREHRALARGGDDDADRVEVPLAVRRRRTCRSSIGSGSPSSRPPRLKTGRAWAIKESLRELWHYTRVGWAERHWKRWYFWATHSRLTPVIETARMIQRHLPNVLTFFAHRITNAVSEGLNSKIQTIKKMAYGFRNREHFKTAIYFHCGGLDLYPTTHGIPG